MLRRALLGAAFLALAGSPLSAHAQQQADRIRVAVDVAEPDGTVLASEFSAALRALGDVDVVSVSEPHQFILRAVVLCEPHDCKQAHAYDLAISFSEPLSIASLKDAILLAHDSLSARRTQRIFAQLPAEEHLDQMFVVQWGEDVYHTSVRELIGQFDQQCFERARMTDRWGRAFIAHDTATANAIQRDIDSRKWVC